MKKVIKKIISVLGILMLLLIVLAIITAAVGYNYYKNSVRIPADSVLEIKFNGDIPELSQAVTIAESLAFGVKPNVSLRQFISLLNHAAKDPKISALSIEGTSSISHSKAVEVSQIIAKFKESGKPVYSYGNYYSQGGYIISSVADSIFINPSGSPDIKGYSIVLTYMKDFFEKYHIDMEVFVAGKYKSYIETYTRNESSPENREQYEIYLDRLLEDLIGQISRNRNIDPLKMRDIIQQDLAYKANKSFELGLVDVIAYKSDYMDFLEDLTGTDKSPLISLSTYQNAIQARSGGKKAANTAFVVVEGEIMVSGSPSSADNLRKAFREIRNDEKIKTIILRINSPGGSAFASEEIWHEIEECKKNGIEIISSVSSVSASGGYYLMAASDKIFANSTSVTGSIGVFIAFPLLENAIEHNLSIHVDKFETSDYSTRINGLSNLSDAQKERYQEITLELYNKFLERVSDGRKMSTDQVDKIAQGRIYVGRDALELNLIDSLLNLSEVLDYVEERIDKKMIIKEYPHQEQKLLPNLDSYINAKLRASSSIYTRAADGKERLDYLLSSKEPMARAPLFEIQK